MKEIRDILNEEMDNKRIAMDKSMKEKILASCKKEKKIFFNKQRKIIAAASAVLIVAIVFGFGAAHDMNLSSPKEEIPYEQDGIKGYGNAEESIGKGITNYYLAKDYNGATADSDNKKKPLKQEKIIYTSEIVLQSKAFEKSTGEITALVKKYNGYIESSKVKGKKQENDLRNANYIFRIPIRNLDKFKDEVKQTGNVIADNISAKNVTEEYTDIKAEIKSLKIHKDALLKLYGRAGTIKDLMNIQEKVSDTQYEIDSLTSQIKDFDKRINYSKASVKVSEVREITKINEEGEKSFFSKIGTSFTDSIKDIGKFFSKAVVKLTYALPILIMIALFALALFVIIRKKIRR